MRPDPRKDTPMTVRGMKGGFALIAVLFAAMIVIAAVTGRAPPLPQASSDPVAAAPER